LSGLFIDPGARWYQMSEQLTGGLSQQEKGKTRAGVVPGGEGTFFWGTTNSRHVPGWILLHGKEGKVGGEKVAAGKGRQSHDLYHKLAEEKRLRKMD